MLPYAATSTSVYLIADLGNRHGGDFELAVRMVSAAARAGVNAVVVDLYQTERISQPGNNDVYRQLKVAELRPTQFRCLAELSHELGIDFIVHPRDEGSLEQASTLADGLWITVPSNRLPTTLKRIIDAGLPIFASGSDEICALLRENRAPTGKADGPEWNRSLTVLQSWPVDNHRLDMDQAQSAMVEIRSELGCAAGVVDRTSGDEAGRMAATIGAQAICRYVDFCGPTAHEQRATLEHLEKWVREIRQVAEHATVPATPQATHSATLRRVA